jgi:uncharacterized protein
VLHLLTDAVSRIIIEKVITPNFKSSNFYTGVGKGLNAVFEILSDEPKEAFKKNSKEKYSSNVKGFFIVIVRILFFVFRNKN